MKTLIASALFALASVSSTVSAVAGDDHSKAASPKAVASFQSSMYVVANSAKMQLAVDKSAGAAVDIKIMNDKGEILAAQRLGKKDTNFRGRFDMSQLADGRYQIVISNGKEETKRAVTISTQPVVNTGRVIALQ